MILDKVIEKMERKVLTKNKGIPVLYVIYDPTQPEPNVFYYSAGYDVYDVMKDPKIINLCKALAGRVRHLYENNPAELERLTEILKEVRG